MKTPEIGTRVRYRRSDKPERTCTGVVNAIYPSDIGRDENGKRYRIPASVSIKVDEPLPDWWNYDRNPDGPWYGQFAPYVTDVTPITD